MPPSGTLNLLDCDAEPLTPSRKSVKVAGKRRKKGAELTAGASTDDVETQSALRSDDVQSSTVTPPEQPKKKSERRKRRRRRRDAAAQGVAGPREGQSRRGSASSFCAVNFKDESDRDNRGVDAHSDGTPEIPSEVSSGSSYIEDSPTSSCKGTRSLEDFGLDPTHIELMPEPGTALRMAAEGGSSCASDIEVDLDDVEFEEESSLAAAMDPSNRHDRPAMRLPSPVSDTRHSSGCGSGVEEMTADALLQQESVPMSLPLPASDADEASDGEDSCETVEECL